MSTERDSMAGRRRVPALGSPRALALAASLLVHLAVLIALALQPGPAAPAPPNRPVEFEVVASAPKPTPTAVEPRQGKAARTKKDPDAPALPARKSAAAAAKASSAPHAAEATAPAAESAASERPAVPALASDLPRRTGGLPSVDLAPGGLAVERAFSGGEDGAGLGVHSPGISRPAPETRQEEALAVKQTVDTLLGDAVRTHQQASHGVDAATVELARSFERAGVSRETDALTESWIAKAFDAYFAELKQRASAPRVAAPRTGGRDAAWEEQKAAARAMLSHSGATYAALVEVRQGSDGKLMDLRLLASSGAQAFDARALGSVVQGLADSPFSPDAGGLGPGRLSLWELTGDRISDSQLVRGAQKAYRYALLDVVPLKETVIELEKGGKTEQMKYSARLIAVY